MLSPMQTAYLSTVYLLKNLNGLSDGLQSCRIRFIRDPLFRRIARPGGSSSPVTANGCRWGRSLRGGFVIPDQASSRDRRSCVPSDVAHAEPGQAGNGAALRVHRMSSGKRRGGDASQHPRYGGLHPQARTFSVDCSVPFVSSLHKLLHLTRRAF